MAKDLATYEGYLAQMVEYRKQQEANKKNVAKFEEYAQKIQVLRHEMIMENVDIYSIERDTYKALYNKEPYDAWLEQANVHIQEAYLTKTMVDLRNRYDTATAIEKASIRSETHQLRMKIIAMGIEPYQFEDRAWLLYRGKALTAAEKTTQYPLVAAAVQDVAKLNAAKKKDLANAPVASWEQKRPNVSKMSLENRYSETYSGADMVIFMAFPGYKPIEIGVASVVSYSIYREKKQIRTVGRVSAKGITKGPRTISGRLIFTVIREHVVEMIRKEIPYLRDIKTLLMDELPAFDILVSFGNEYGGSAGLVIQGITVVDEQKTLSIEDLFTENIFTYIARALEPMRSLAFKSGEPYEPLKWFTSSFRAAGSEVLGNFKPKETQLFHDAQILTTPTPFYGSAAGWDSSKYNLEIGIPIGDLLSNESGGSSGGGPNGSTSGDWSDSPGLEDNILLVQVVAPEGAVMNSIGGTVVLKHNGKQVGSKRIQTYDKKVVSPPFTLHPQVSLAKNQIYPMELKGGYIDCALFEGIPYVKNDKLEAFYTDSSGKWKAATGSVEIHSDQTWIVVKTLSSTSTSTMGAIATLKYERHHGGSDVNLYFSQKHPVNNNYGSKKSLTPIRNLDTIAKATKKLPTSIHAFIKDNIPQGLNDWPVRWIWTLDLSFCDKVDNALDWTDGDEVEKLNNIDQNNGSNSMAAAAYWVKNGGTAKGYYDQDSMSNGEISFNPNDFFWTVSKLKNKTSKKLTWDDLPADALLTFSCTAFKTKDSKKTSADNFSTLNITFRKNDA